MRDDAKTRSDTDCDTNDRSFAIWAAGFAIAILAIMVSTGDEDHSDLSIQLERPTAR